MPNNRFVIKDNTPVENFPLLFFKLVPKVVIELQGRSRNQPPQRVVAVDHLLNRGDERLKPALLKRIVEIFNAQGGRRKVYSPFVREYLNTLREDGFELLEFSTNSNLAVGLGIPAFFENGLTFHHTYGVPYLPASSVKGLLRYAFWGEALGVYPFGVDEVPKPFELLTEDDEETLEENKEEALERAFKVISKLDGLMANSETFNDFKKALTKKVEEESLPVRVIEEEKLKEFFEIFKTFFGTQKVAGKVIFADALPTEFKLGVDIMNPHFRDYYQSKEKKPVQVAEIYNPVPIQFLVVEDAKFSMPYKITAEDGREILEKIIEKLLKEAFALLGVGGKRRKGYGKLS